MILVMVMVVVMFGNVLGGCGDDVWGDGGSDDLCVVWLIVNVNLVVMVISMVVVILILVSIVMVEGDCNYDGNCKGNGVCDGEVGGGIVCGGF